ncbi:MAG: hypothetical protein AAGG44_16860, partial [Planctomycetota bacterium]
MLASGLLLMAIAATQSGCSLTSFGSFAKTRVLEGSAKTTSAQHTTSQTTSVAAASFDDGSPTTDVGFATYAASAADGEPLFRNVAGVAWPAQVREPAKLVSSSLRNAPERSFR